jgi:ribosome biogenesis GTPase A
MSASRSKPSRSNPTAFGRLKEQLQAVDLLFEVRDARVPAASRHPKSEEIFGNKPRIIVLAKQDLADASQLKAWLDALSVGDERDALALSFKLHKGQDKLIASSLRLTEPKRQALARKGLLPRPMRACVVGLPNVGKSTLINWFTGRHKAKTGDRPGITRGTQWVRVHPQLELLDTPGFLPPVAFSHETMMKLALCNVVPDDHYDFADVAEYGLALLARENPKALQIYGTELVEAERPNLEQLALARKCVAAGGVPDTRRAAISFVNDFRNGKLGQFVLDQLSPGT